MSYICSLKKINWWRKIAWFILDFFCTQSSKPLWEIKRSCCHLRLQSDPSSAQADAANKQQICRYKPKLTCHCFPCLSQHNAQLMGRACFDSTWHLYWVWIILYHDFQHYRNICVCLERFRVQRTTESTHIFNLTESYWFWCHILYVYINGVVFLSWSLKKESIFF